MKVKLILLTMALLFCISCGTQKELQVLNDSVQAELAEREFMRAASSGKSYDKQEAKFIAEENARLRLEIKIQNAVADAAKTYFKKEPNRKAYRFYRKQCKQNIGFDINGYQIIASDIYMLPDGITEYYVCIEMRMGKNELAKDVANRIVSHAGFTTYFNQERFEEELANALKTYPSEEYLNIMTEKNIKKNEK